MSSFAILFNHSNTINLLVKNKILQLLKLWNQNDIMKALLIIVSILLIFTLSLIFLLLSKEPEKLETSHTNTTTQELGTTSTTLKQTTTTTIQSEISIKENEVELSSSGFNKNYIKLPIGTPLIVINRDSKTHNLRFEELEVSYVLDANDKLEFPTIEKGKLTIRDEESGNTLTLEII